MCAHKANKKRNRAGISEVKTLHDMDHSVLLMEQEVDVIDLISKSTCPETRKKQMIGDVNCNCPMCDFDECVKFAKEVFPNGLIPVENGRIAANIPEITCRRNRHIPSMSNDECLVRDFLKNTIGKG